MYWFLSFDLIDCLTRLLEVHVQVVFMHVLLTRHVYAPLIEHWSGLRVIDCLLLVVIHLLLHWLRILKILESRLLIHLGLLLWFLVQNLGLLNNLRLLLEDRLRLLHDVLLLILLCLLVAGLNGHLLLISLIHLNTLFDVRLLLYDSLVNVARLLIVLLLRGLLLGDA